MDLQKEIAALEAETERKRQSLIKQHALLQVVADAIGKDTLDKYYTPFVHHSKLYGSVGSIHFSICEYETLRKGSINPDADLLRKLLAAFPPEPMVKVSDGCTSFRPDLGETISDNPNAKEYECFGVIVKVETYRSQKAVFHWYAELNAELWSIDVEFSWWYTKLGRLDMIPIQSHGVVISWERCEIYPEVELNAQRIRWVSGGREYPNTFTLYWDRDSGSKLDFPSLIEE